MNEEEAEDDIWNPDHLVMDSHNTITLNWQTIRGWLQPFFACYPIPTSFYLYALNSASYQLSGTQTDLYGVFEICMDEVAAKVIAPAA
jgi:hypothetical protein